MKKLKKLRSDLTLNIISMLILLLLIFSLIVSLIGYYSFAESFKKAYTTSTYHMADAATTLVRGDSIDRYLSEGADEEHAQIQHNLDTFCTRMHVSLVYVIKVDTSGYDRFVSVFNSVNNTVDKTQYTPWELGYQRDTTNDEYRRKYMALYSGETPYETVFRTKDLKGLHPHITTLVPVKNSADEVVALLCIQRPISELSESLIPFLIKIAVTTLLVALITVILNTLYIRRHFVKPLSRVAAEATRFARENTQGEPLSGVSRISDIADLAASVDKMEADMVRYIDHLTAATAEKERMSVELSIAATIQENSIPNRFPAFPGRDDFDIYASMTPAKQVGGDFYNFFLIDDDHLAFVIGDVSGKGIPAALFMMVINILISNRAKIGSGTPAEILTYVNDNICQHNNASMFVTLWLGILEISSGKLTFANAGHDDAALYRRGGSFSLYQTPHSLATGAMEGVPYKDYVIQMQPGDKLFLYTDGVPEANNSESRMFTLDRMLAVLNRCKDSSPEGVLSGIRQDVDAFVGDAPQFDDLTMLCVELKEKPLPSLTVDATIENLDRVNEFLESVLEDCPPKPMMQLNLMVEEIYVNIAHYAYPDGGGKAQITAERDSDSVTLTFRDCGVPYDPLKKPDPDTTLSAEERQIGGLGIFLVKQYADDVSYAYEDGQNVLKITKKLS